MTDFSAIDKVCVPKQLVDKAQSFLRSVGATGREGLVLWVGRSDGNVFRVTNLLIPRQRGLKTKDGVCVVVDADEMHRINVELFQSGLRLIAQMHSHPTDAYHSQTDDEFAIATTVGALSLVVPDFATREFDLRDSAVYRLSTEGVWDEVSHTDANRLIAIEAT